VATQAFLPPSIVLSSVESHSPAVCDCPRIMSRPIDKEFEEADDTGVLDISGRNLRQFPVIPGDMLDFSYIFEAGTRVMGVCVINRSGQRSSLSCIILLCRWGSDPTGIML
jgi:hypothetical protein